MAELFETLEDWQAGRSLVDCNKFMFLNEISCDVTFLLGQKKEPVKAHKYILISRSSVFQSIFCGSISGSKEGSDVIPVSDIQTDTFKALLMFLYCDKTDITNSNVNNLLYAAKKYAVLGLVGQCLAFLESSLCAENVCGILEQVHLYNGKSLETKCFNCIFENGKTVLESKDFTDLCPSCVEQIVKSDELVVEEVTVYEAVLRWAGKECGRRGLQISDTNIREVLGATLFHIRFPLLPAVFFTNNVSTREVLNSQEIIAVFQYFHGRSQPTNWKFNTNRRRGFSLHSVIRYNLILMEALDCKGTTHTISFTCSQPVILHGVIVYGCLEGSAMYQVRVELLDENKGIQPETGQAKDCKTKSPKHEISVVNGKLTNDKSEIESLQSLKLWSPKVSEHPIPKQLNVSYTTLTADRTQHVYDVILSKPVQLIASRHYCVRLEMDGPPTKLGVHGKIEATSEGVNFQFFSHEGNKTCVDKGQIPGLLFTLPSLKAIAAVK